MNKEQAKQFLVDSIKVYGEMCANLKEAKELLKRNQVRSILEELEKNCDTIENHKTECLKSVMKNIDGLMSSTEDGVIEGLIKFLPTLKN